MDSMAGSRVRFRDDGPRVEDFRTAVLAGLSSRPRTLPCKFFYDKNGSALFERICALEEYYPTRTETGILERHGLEFAAILGRDCHLIEFGSGSSTKIRRLLAALDRPGAYTAIDISREHLIESTRGVAEAFPDIAVEAICADYTRGVAVEAAGRPADGMRIGFFPGSTIGNFAPEEARDFLALVARTLGKDAALLIGVDLKKDERLLVAAYNDREGVTASFNRNLLVRINRELGGDFDLAGFRHEAPYNRGLGRIEMHLVSTRPQTVRVDGRAFAFEEGESIHTENSYKYTIEEFRGLARGAGFTPAAAWTDADRMFGVHLLRVR